MPKESRSRMQKWPSSTLCPPNSTVTGTTHFYPVAIRSAHVICAQALSMFSFLCASHALVESVRRQPLAPALMGGRCPSTRCAMESLVCLLSVAVLVLFLFPSTPYRHADFFPLSARWVL